VTELSNRQIDRLGDRLRISDPTAKDLELLGQVRGLYAGALAEVTRVLVDLGYEPGARLKTVGTLVDKLRRIPEPLSRIQDVAGARVVVEMNRENRTASSSGSRPDLTTTGSRTGASTRASATGPSATASRLTSLTCSSDNRSRVSESSMS